MESLENNLDGVSDYFSRGSVPDPLGKETYSHM